MANECYVNVDGANHEISYVKVGASGVHHVIAAYAGVNGAVRRIPGLSRVDHVLIRLESVKAWNYEKQGYAAVDLSSSSQTITVTYSGATLGEVFMYPLLGQLRVRCREAGWRIDAVFTVSLVYPDGCEITPKNLYDITEILSEMSVTCAANDVDDTMIETEWAFYIDGYYTSKQTGGGYTSFTMDSDSANTDFGRILIESGIVDIADDDAPYGIAYMDIDTFTYDGETMDVTLSLE